jgi:hypothetical protein
MKRCLFLLVSIVAVQIALPIGLDADENNKRPNVVFILADDSGFSDLGCYGSEIETTNLDEQWCSSKMGENVAGFLESLWLSKLSQWQMAFGWQSPRRWF